MYNFDIKAAPLLKRGISGNVQTYYLDELDSFVV